jgi:hypothetical protein
VKGGGLWLRAAPALVVDKKKMRKEESQSENTAERKMLILRCGLPRVYLLPLTTAEVASEG